MVQFVYLVLKGFVILLVLQESAGDSLVVTTNYYVIYIILHV